MDEALGWFAFLRTEQERVRRVVHLRAFCSGADGKPADRSWIDWQPAIKGQELAAEIRVSLVGGTGEVSLLIGRVDHIEANPITGAIHLEGRDRTADLIETKTFTSYKNQMASGIATAIAAEHGLTPVVTATTTPAGRYYNVDHDKLSLGQFSKATTEWDLLTELAEFEGFDVFVQGTELHFQPATNPNATPWLIQVGQPTATRGYRTLNAKSLTLSRALTLAKNIVVVVKSWNSKQGKGFQVTAPASAAKGSVKSGKAQQYIYIRPNLGMDKAQALANSIYTDLVLHERDATIVLPGEVILTPRNMLQVTGTGTGWDTTYYINEITRRIAYEGGFEETIQVKNQSPQSEGAASAAVG